MPARADDILTGADVHIEAPDGGLYRRQIFLILRGDMRLGDGLAAGRALRGQRDVMGLLHDARDVAAGPDGHAAAPGRRPGRRGRRFGAPFETAPLAARRPDERLPPVLQARVLSLVVPLALHPCTVGFDRSSSSQPHDLLSQLGDRLVRPRLACARHSPVMPEFAPVHKSDPVTRYKLH